MKTPVKVYLHGEGSQNEQAMPRFDRGRSCRHILLKHVENCTEQFTSKQVIDHHFHDSKVKAVVAPRLMLR